MTMEEMPMKKMIEAALENIRKVADADTVIGQPIVLPDGVTVIPFSKVSVGFASGGSDIDSKATPGKQKFAGGNGAGLTVTPLGFIIAANGDVRVIDLNHPVVPAASSDPVNKALDMVDGVLDRAPGLIDRIKEMISNALKESREKKKECEDNSENQD